MSLALLGGAAALGSAVIGGAASIIENNKARKLLQGRLDEENRWYNIQRSKDYTQRADVQAAINQQRQMLQEQLQRSRATNIVSGGSEEAIAAEKEAANRAAGQTMSDVAAASAAHNDAVEAQHKAKVDAITQQQIQNHQQQAAQIAQAAGQAVSAGVNVVGNELGSVTPDFVGAGAPSIPNQLKKVPK